MEWNGHELSNRVDELERLGERRKMAVMGIYAEKSRQKHWYDSKVRRGIPKGRPCFDIYSKKTQAEIENARFRAVCH